MGLTSNREQEEAFADIARLIEASDEVAICAHTSPDGDAIGSGLALGMIIRRAWPQKRVWNLLADDAPVPSIYAFLPGADQMVRACAYQGRPDLFVSVDLSVDARLNDGEAVLARSRHHAIIDHHPCLSHTGEAFVIRPSAAASGVIVTELALFLGVRLDAAMAQCLFCAIVTDTGRFQYQNADPESFQVASLLVDAGASPSEVSLNVYQSFSLSYLHLESAVMGRITTFAGGKIAYSYATQEDLERTGASLDECDGLIDVVRSVAGSEVALFLKEIPGGQVRGNLRSKTTHDVSSVAASLGGGGHVAAAGFTVDGTVDETLATVLPKLRDLVDVSDWRDGTGSLQ
ncbi:DHH family phosphoesterase [Olsenella massiliensis]|uniref:DHH family phosphoesterase n=1 Tax=Olsenella massiliensis TaxID=1622075 RepID=UPI00071DE058|nr:DHH family phosphoesterase [Olsenella massiliensis]